MFFFYLTIPLLIELLKANKFINECINATRILLPAKKGSLHANDICLVRYLENIVHNYRMQTAL